MAIAQETSSVDIQRAINRKRDGFSTPRANLALTTSYVATSHIDCSQANKVNVYFTLTWVDSTSTEYYVEWSYDGTTWFRSLNISPSGATNTVLDNTQTRAASASAKWVDTFPRQGSYMRLFVKKSGGVGADALLVETQATSL